jgi:hypothetical protein
LPKTTKERTCSLSLSPFLFDCCLLRLRATLRHLTRRSCYLSLGIPRPPETREWWRIVPFFDDVDIGDLRPPQTNNVHHTHTHIPSWLTKSEAEEEEGEEEEGEGEEEEEEGEETSRTAAGVVEIEDMAEAGEAEGKAKDEEEEGEAEDEEEEDEAEGEEEEGEAEDEDEEDEEENWGRRENGEW